MARRDYFYDAEAPKPNSIRPAAAVGLFDPGGNMLLLRRKDNDKWTMPGGTLDFGESLTACAIGEVREETGLQVRITA
jgi:8-oxo-dGTP diphosphatase